MADDPTNGWLAEKAEEPPNRLEAENWALPANASESPTIREAEKGKVESGVAEA
jgi:hypothetical protein